MVGIAAHDTSKELTSLGMMAQTQVRLRPEEQRGRFLTELEVLLKEQHRWQRCGEIVNLSRSGLQFAGVGEQIRQEPA